MHPHDYIKSIIKARNLALKDSSRLCLRSFATSTKAVEENGAIEIIVMATTEDVDGEKEVVLADGIDWEYFNLNSKIFGDHQYGLTELCAVKRYIKKVPANDQRKAGWELKARLLKSGQHYAMLCELAELDTIGASVGLEALDIGPLTPDEQKAHPGARSIIRKSRAIEVSFTAMPMNVYCQSTDVFTVPATVKRFYSFADAGKLKNWNPPAKRRLFIVGK